MNNKLLNAIDSLMTTLMQYDMPPEVEEEYYKLAKVILTMAEEEGSKEEKE
jgi:hypothetical protein